jgi:hypothetical protein
MPETYEEMYSEIEEVAKELEPQPQPEVLAKALKSGFLWQKAIGWVKEHTGSQAQQVKEHSGSQAQQPASAQPAEAGSSAAAMERQVVTEGRKVQLSPSLDHEDFRYVANTIRAEVGGPLSELYAKATGDINDPKVHRVYTYWSRCQSFGSNVHARVTYPHPPRFTGHGCLSSERGHASQETKL